MKCTCNGMEFICNKWVFTGQCICKTLPDWERDEPMWTYAPYDYGVTFTWRGGAYIDVVNRMTGEAIDCINVWNYETDEPTIDYTSDAPRRECEAWLEDNCDQE